jgi:HEPN domain-containing protein
MRNSTEPTFWLKRASQDIRSAKNNLDDSPHELADAICYACQQAAEKYLKAFLLKKKEALIKTHDLVFLGRRAKRLDPVFKGIEQELLELNEYSLEARYPGDFFGELTGEDAHSAYVSALRVEKLVRSFFESGKEGF